MSILRGAHYKDSGVSLSALYFSLLAFLLVAWLVRTFLFQREIGINLTNCEITSELGNNG
ncbi:hypothetical protein P9597_25865 [Aneurinibacillus migulanus]|uniref:hypothetical protein n=1 Tax=Aneurinibacillus migulanus TaxID=47500 RepID=UPI002E1D6171|nr:hypothetical protein [Aneurinibacillus migulanus]